MVDQRVLFVTFLLGEEANRRQVIRETFTPLLPPGKLLPDQLATRLLDRFSSADGYILTEPRLPHLLRILKGNSPQRVYDNIVIGVVTNSDDRVPGILSSLGVLVSPFRYGTPINRELPLTIPYEIDFHCMSYDVGCEKPDRRIFEAAEEMLGAMLQTRARPESDGSGWDKLYVGDEYEKDAKAALAAGWAAALLGENGPPSVTDNAVGTLHHHDHQHDPPDAILTGRRIVVVKSIGTLVEWLIGRSLLGGRE